MEEIIGYFTYEVYRKDDWACQKWKCNDEKITVTGEDLPSNKHLQFLLRGEWEDTKYGKTFKCFSSEQVITTDKESIISYLSSSAVKGVGKKTAEKIYDMFQSETLNVIENNTDELLKIKGISKDKAIAIKDSLLSTKALSDFMDFACKVGVTPRQAIKYFRKNGLTSKEKLKEYPYSLTEIYGIDFLDAEVIAKNLGINKKSKERFLACSKFIISRRYLTGNLGIELNVFLDELVKYIGKDFTSEEIKENLAYFSKYKEIYIRTINNVQYIFLYNDYIKERLIARKIKSLCTSDEFYTSNVSSWNINSYLKMLDGTQRRAVFMALSNNFSIITGGPGTGKTTVINTIKEIYKDFFKKDLVFLAPTGRAAKRISETSKVYASTIHKKLGLGTDNAETDVTISNALVVVDEVSMVDTYLCHELVKSFGKNVKVIFVGDIDQLPSVGAGAILRDLIASEVIPITKLENIYRQEHDSVLYRNIQKIKKGDTNIEEDKTFKIVECSPEIAKQKIIKSYTNSYTQRNNFDDLMCLIPVKKGNNGTYSLNSALEEIYVQNDKSVSFGAFVFKEGDRVMNLKNRDFITNGDIGVVTFAGRRENVKVVEVNFDGETIEYDSNSIDELVLAYTSTIHKSQGSEAKDVIIYVSDEQNYNNMLTRNLIYTAVSRAKERVVVYGSRSAWDKAILNIVENKRITLLSTLLKEEFSKTA